MYNNRTVIISSIFHIKKVVYDTCSLTYIRCIFYLLLHLPASEVSAQSSDSCSLGHCERWGAAGLAVRAPAFMRQRKFIGEKQKNVLLQCWKAREGEDAREQWRKPRPAADARLSQRLLINMYAERGKTLGGYGERERKEDK